MVGISCKKNVVNNVFLETYSTHEDYKKTHEVKVDLESLIIYNLYKYCTSPFVSIKFVTVNKSIEEKQVAVTLFDQDLNFMDASDVPWTAASCIYPVVMCEDFIVTGLCAVARQICINRNCRITPQEHVDGLLGFRQTCLQAPNEVSVWTKFCEVDIIKTVKEILTTADMKELPKHLVRFEDHLKKPVKVHNMYKIAQDISNENEQVARKSKQERDNVEQLPINSKQELKQNEEGPSQSSRVPKARKWRTSKFKGHIIDSSTKIEDLNIRHEFAEGPFLTIADLVLLPSYSIINQSFGEQKFESLLPLTYKWYKNLISIEQVQAYVTCMSKLNLRTLALDDVIVPATENVSLYKCDPKRHNPKKRPFTKEDDIEKALSYVTEGMEINVSSYEFESSVNWDDIPEGANPNAGHLPEGRVYRKSQQLENLAQAVLSVAREGDLIVDFCCGSGHLGILLAHLLPKCTIILLENKARSLLNARERVHSMGLKNVYHFQCNLDFYIGDFDIGIGLHACGIASDLILDKCLKANAKFILSPCCYGSLHATDRMVYPRSSKFGTVPIDYYLCIGHAADQTHEEHPLAIRGARCMAIIDSDRGRLAEEHGYKVTLCRLKPLTCTPKNNLLIGLPS